MSKLSIDQISNSTKVRPPRFWLTLLPSIGLLLLLTVACKTNNTNPAKPDFNQSDNLESKVTKPVEDLALHLKQVDAKMYGAYWCPFCSRQQQLFGEAFRNINYIECDPRGSNAQPKLCANVAGFPTWEIKGRLYRGFQTLEELADISGYNGSRQFE